MPNLEAQKKEMLSTPESKKFETPIKVADKISIAANQKLAEIIKLKPKLKKVPEDMKNQLEIIDAVAVEAREDLDSDIDKNLRIVTPEKQEQNDLNLDIKSAFNYAGFNLDQLQLSQIASKLKKQEKIDTNYLFSLAAGLNDEQKEKLIEGTKFLFNGQLKMSFKEKIKFYASKERGRAWGGMELTMTYQKALVLFEEINGQAAKTALYPGSGDDWSGTIPSLWQLDNITGLDLSRGYSNNLTKQYKNFKFLDADITKFQNKKIESLPTDSFDILATGEFNCPIGNKNAIAEFKRLLKPNGFIIIIDKPGAEKSSVAQTSKVYQEFGTEVSSSKNGNFKIIQIKKEPQIK